MTTAFSENNEPLLHVDSLSIRIGHEPEQFTTSGTSFSLKKGETIGIVGESGSGKSITSLCIMGLLPKEITSYDQGAITWNDGVAVDLLNIDEEAKRKMRGNKIAMIFQEPMTSLNPSMRCGKQITESLQLHLNMNKEEAKTKTLSLFEQVKLPDPPRIFSSYPHQLSGGQRQRVMIAMALAGDPELLIADEPTTALDITVQRSILDLLKSIQKERKIAIIFITHDLGVVSHVSDQLLVMQKGKVVEYGNTEQVTNNPKAPYTKGLIACRPPVTKRPHRLLTVQDFLTEKEQINEKLISVNERAAQHTKIYDRPPILEVKDLWVKFANKGGFGKKKTYVEAVKGVNFNVFEGETLGLVGESGCGKSTLARAILRLIPEVQGHIHFNGQDVMAMGKNELRKLRRDFQIIFQDPYSSLNPKQKVGEAIKEAMRWHKIHSSEKEMDRALEELLERVGLQSKQQYRYPHEFSGGQRQRVNIARTIALKPKLVICDESVSALDVSVQAQVLNLLNDLKDDLQLTYIFISHDLSVIKYMSDRVMVMNKGEIEEIEEADQLYSNPKSSYTESLISAQLSL